MGLTDGSSPGPRFDGEGPTDTGREEGGIMTSGKIAVLALAVLVAIGGGVAFAGRAATTPSDVDAVQIRSDDDARRDDDPADGVEPVEDDRDDDTGDGDDTKGDDGTSGGWSRTGDGDDTGGNTGGDDPETRTAASVSGGGDTT
jgi:hypothetical protein